MISEDNTLPSVSEMRIVYIRPARREHELLPLLEDSCVHSIRSRQDLFQLKVSSEPRTVVLIDYLGRWAFFGMLASMYLRAPLIIRLRGEFFREERNRLEARRGWLRWMRYWNNVLLARLAFLKADAVLCNSRYLAKAIAPYIQGKPIEVVHNPHVAPFSRQSAGESSSFPEAKLKLLTVTNMNLGLKVQPIFRAIEQWIPDEFWRELDFHWIICGTGSHENRLRNLVKDKGLQGKIHILGRIEDISKAYEWCDVLLHLTGLDAFPNSPMEAMGFGRPVITNVDSCGTREQVFDGENGFVVDDCNEFIDALRAYSENPDLRRAHGRAGKSLVEKNFSPDAQRARMHTVLEKFISSREKESER